MSESKKKSGTKQKKNKKTIPGIPADSRPGCRQDDIERPLTDTDSRSPAASGQCNQGDKLHKTKKRRF